MNVFALAILDMTFQADFWTEKYESGSLGWDIGYPSAPLKAYIDQLRETNSKILIPGCGNAYEAGYLLLKGFTDIHLLDISPFPVEDLRSAFYPTYEDRLNLYCEDFFDHEGQYNLILEQTFFCALNPDYREAYVKHMADLLKPGGHLAGVLFTFPFSKDGPPFGGSIEEYQSLFANDFKIRTLQECYNSIQPRQGNEAFIILEKPDQ